MLPLVFMIIVGIVSRSNIEHAIGGSVATAGTYATGAQPARDESMRALSLGLGSYVALLASLYFAFVSVKRFLASKAIPRQELQPAARKAA
jgi:hypothetical protein